MLLSKFFIPVLKEKPVEAHVMSHALMLRAGLIRQSSAGIYSWLPLGLKVLKNIENIIRQNMDEAGLIELLMPCVQDGNLWRESGRLDVYGEEMLKFKDRHGQILLFGPTNEELVTDIIRNSVQSYKELPKILYQIQWKFRDEIRPRFGVMRGREFLMKDAYSIDIDHESAVETYNLIFKTYLKTFSALGLKAIALSASSGEIGGDLSHEFHVIAETGESTIYYDKKYDELDPIEDFDKLKTLYAVTEEKYDAKTCPIDRADLSIKKGIEVGHIFNFADKYSTSMKANVNDKNGQKRPLQMGSYGIGVSRLVAAVIEVSHDDRGIIWPIQIAPFKVAIVNLNCKNEECNKVSKIIYDKLRANNIECLYDDNSDSAGSKLAMNDLIGTPWQVIIGPKKLEAGFIELKERKTGQVIDAQINDLAEMIIDKLNVK